MAISGDIELNGTEYQNLYATVGITVGTPINIQNKSSWSVLLQNVASKPTSEEYKGRLVSPYQSVRLEGSILGCWAKGNGPVYVEEAL